jgi:ubiquitin-protein ligase
MAQPIRHNRSLTKQLQILQNVGLPFEYRLRLEECDEDDACYWFDFRSTRFLGSPDQTVAGWVEKIYLYFPLDYPLRPPTIFFGFPLEHANVLPDADGEVCLGDWCPAITLHQILINLYMIYTEAKFKRNLSKRHSI